MRCPECNKFASYDDSTDPEVDSLDVDQDGNITGSVRIVLTCAEDSTELKEATFDLDAHVSDTFAEAHKGEGHELSVDDDGFSLSSRQETESRRTKKDGTVVVKPIPFRYRRTYYGFDGDVTVTCECGATESVHVADEIPAGAMDELT